MHSTHVDNPFESLLFRHHRRSSDAKLYAFALLCERGWDHCLSVYSVVFWATIFRYVNVYYLMLEEVLRNRTLYIFFPRRYLSLFGYDERIDVLDEPANQNHPLHLDRGSRETFECRFPGSCLCNAVSVSDTTTGVQKFTHRRTTQL